MLKHYFYMHEHGVIPPHYYWYLYCKERGRFWHELSGPPRLGRGQIALEQAYETLNATTDRRKT